jgi:hypothetical protein
MTNEVALDNVAHQSLKVIARHGPEFADNVNKALLFPTEFADAQREYPIVFRKDAAGDWQALALLGLDKDENLFLDGKRWNARYVPAVHMRGPFLIGFRNKEENGEKVREPMVFVDMDNPRVSQSEGEPLFLPQGGNAPYLERINRVLQVIYQGVEVAKPVYAAFEEYDLFDSMKVEIELSNRAKYTLPDLYTISQERLATLDGASLERLNRAGFLHLAMLVVTSMGNISWLIDLKNRKNAAG